MERQRGHGTYALIGVAAVLVVAVMVGALFWGRPAANGSGSAPVAVPVATPARTTAEAPARMVAKPPINGAQAPVSAVPGNGNALKGVDNIAANAVSMTPPREPAKVARKSEPTSAPPPPASDKPGEVAGKDATSKEMAGKDTTGKDASGETTPQPAFGNGAGQDAANDKAGRRADMPVSSARRAPTTKAEADKPNEAKPVEALPADTKPEAKPTEPKSPEAPAAKAVAGEVEPGAAPTGASPAEPPKQPDKPAAEAIVPTFDHVRIEPDGINVFAGRAAPGATVEMVRDGEVYARAAADTSGLFAISAPALPVGPSHVFLQSIAPDGRREISKESVTVLVDHSKTRRPLVALTSPDKPTVVLSNPDAPDSHGSEQAGGRRTGQPQQQGQNRPDIEIATVEAREGGQLFVSGRAAPGAAVRMYLNDAMVAPGGADSEGRVSFMIPRGMVPGRYTVRLDDVDPVSGHVKSKAEVAFQIPEADGDMLADGQGIAAGHGIAGGQGSGGRQMPAGSQGAGQKPEQAADASFPLLPAMATTMVRRGDSLWSISQRHYGTGYLYLEVYDANLRKIENPNLIYPGQVLVLPTLETPDTR